MSSDQDEVTLSIVTVSWNVRELLRESLRSIEQQRGQLDLEMIVVDVNSHDGSPTMILEEFPWVKLIQSKENLGFTRGNNLGIAAATGRNILLLNPDTITLDDALTTMCCYLEDHPDVGAVGPQVLNVDGSIQSSRRRFPSLATGLFESTWLEPFAPPALLQHYYALDLADNVESDVDWVIGACLMVPRAVIDRVGLLDEGFFMYSEELDWCHRIKDAGWRIVYYPEAKIIHHVGKSSEQAITARHINFQQSKLRYFRKYHGRTAAAGLRLFLLLNYTWQIGLEGSKGLLGSKRELRKQRMLSYWNVLRSGLRPAGY